MLRILRYLKGSKAAVLAIVILLMIQAYCDLSLPQYTSDIVDVGIQQGGIELPNKDASLDSQRELLELRAQYEAQGVDLAKLQTDYLLRKGGEMLALSLVMVVAAVLVGLLAARTAAKVGMELRSSVYKKVISFSGGELDKFSTASLITRTTNDIQQVQMVSVMLLRMVAYAPILGIGGIVKVMGTNTGMSWIIVVAVGSMILLVSVLMSLAMPRFKKMQTLVDKLNL
ncbi:MAG: ABC transporter transmembrane domain-containing protein, partial [Angelakisella sp.]